MKRGADSAIFAKKNSQKKLVRRGARRDRISRSAHGWLRWTSLRGRGDLRDCNSLACLWFGEFFPWPQEGVPLLWFSPSRRGVLDFKELHWPRRFVREIKKGAGFEVTFNRAFTEVIEACVRFSRAHTKQARGSCRQ